MIRVVKCRVDRTRDHFDKFLLQSRIGDDDPGIQPKGPRKEISRGILNQFASRQVLGCVEQSSVGAPLG